MYLLMFRLPALLFGAIALLLFRSGLADRRRRADVWDSGLSRRLIFVVALIVARVVAVRSILRRRGFASALLTWGPICRRARRSAL